MGTQPHEESPDPLHEWYATGLFLTAMDLACLEFALRRDASDLTVECPNGTSWDLNSFIRLRGHRDYSGNEDRPPPADRVWERLLEIAGMEDDRVSEGKIRFNERARYPYTDWTVDITRDGPDRLDFGLTLDRVDTSIPTSEAE